MTTIFFKRRHNEKRLTLSLNQELSKNLLKTKIDVLVVGVSEGRTLNSIAEKVDKATQGSIKKLIKEVSLSQRWVRQLTSQLMMVLLLKEFS